MIDKMIRRHRVVDYTYPGIYEIQSKTKKNMLYYIVYPQKSLLATIIKSI